MSVGYGKAEIAALETAEEQKEVAERVVRERLTRDQVAGVVREKAGKKADRVQFKLEDGSAVTVTGPAAANEAATKAALLKLARKLGRGEAA